jgi:hypothetical protein
MSDPHDLEQVRADVEDRQRNILWEDARRGGKSVDAFLWNGDPNATPVQRAGLVVFAIAFLLIAVFFGSIPFENHSEDGRAVEFLFAFFWLLISLRLFRNACLCAQEPSHNSLRDRQNGKQSE